jgi:hypothetical protein
MKTRTRAVGYGVTPTGAQRVKQFNEDLRLVQGFKVQLAATAVTTLTPKLNSAARSLLGIAIIPVASGDISDTQVTFAINNLNVLLDVAAPNLNPNFVSNMMFYPVPQQLFGTDTLKFSFLKNDANAVSVIVNLYYLPQKGK